MVVVLMVGLPGSGKTTRARQLEAEGALRFSLDEWMLPLFAGENGTRQRDTLEGRLIWAGLRAAELGVDVVLDFGFWSRAERDALRHLFAAVGAECVVEFLDVDPTTQWERVSRRQLEAPGDTFTMTRGELDHWRTLFEVPTAEELATSTNGPPAGFLTWSAWAADRWPSLPDRGR
ncbi:ATP-binding protein [Kineococcus sp. NBC_00420]|uniref:AAA family ATPase n=1 Tax=unclassified Kineococcus TaxID=2621656 RepID=UPI002E1D0A3B